MSLFSWFKKKEPQLKPQRVERIGIRHRLKPPKKQYRATVAIVFNGKPLRQFEVTDKGYSRDAVAAKIEEQLTIKLMSVHQVKTKK